MCIFWSADEVNNLMSLIKLKFYQRQLISYKKTFLNDIFAFVTRRIRIIIINGPRKTFFFVKQLNFNSYNNWEIVLSVKLRC